MFFMLEVFLFTPDSLRHPSSISSSVALYHSLLQNLGLAYWQLASLHLEFNQIRRTYDPSNTLPKYPTPAQT